MLNFVPTVYMLNLMPIVYFIMHLNLYVKFLCRRLFFIFLVVFERMYAFLQWIPSAINSIQTGFILLGNFLSGHIADAVGGKIPIFMSLIVLIVCNVISSFSVRWVCS